jgi:hypothetical protein
MIEELTYYRVTCDSDGCENTCPAPHEETTAWSDPDSALVVAAGSEWHIMPERHLCPDHEYEADE